MKEIFSRIQLKHDSAENWKNSSIIPLAGELIIYDADSVYSYPRFKFGDGVKTANELPFVGETELAELKNSCEATDEANLTAILEYLAEANYATTDDVSAVDAKVEAVSAQTQELLDRANNGEFGGTAGADGYGVLGLDVVNGDLIITTEAVEGVNFSLDDNGNLIYNFG